MAKLALLRGASEGPPAVSDARVALAKAIADHAEAELNRTRLHTAHERLSADVRRAIMRLTAAEDGLAKVKQELPAAIVARVLDGEAVSVNGTGQAKAELAAAQEALAEAREARDVLAARATDEQKEVEWAEFRVKEAARRVLREEAGIGDLLGDLERLQRELVAKGSELLWLINSDVLPMRSVAVGPRPPIEERAQAVWNRLGCPPVTWNGLLRDPSVAGDAKWRQALDALMRDAAAPLP